VLKSWSESMRKSLTVHGHYTSSHSLYMAGIDASWTGALVTGAGVAPDTRITSVQGTQIWISKQATSAGQTAYALKLERADLQAELEACRADAQRALDGVFPPPSDAVDPLPAGITRVDAAAVGLPPLRDDRACDEAVHAFCRSLFPLHLIRQRVVQRELVRPLTELFSQSRWSAFDAAALERDMAHREEAAVFEQWRDAMLRVF